jgi:predicted unusual protein kinase regulating ubiquinone biosynthesis (AarF/ABC1/UbiB family)
MNVPSEPRSTPTDFQYDPRRNSPPTPDATDSEKGDTSVNLKRYRKVRWFFAKAFLHILWWDVILNRPVLQWFRSSPLPRWQNIASRYRELAVEMGGVLIKLGQFLSVRVDILPREVIVELAGLQDEIPPEPLDKIVAQIEDDFQRPLTQLFSWLSPLPLGAASLAQVHRARLPSGQEVVVKVLRPGIGVLVETDLTAIGLAIRWLKLYHRVSRRIDLDALAEEFIRITRQELDFEAEGRNAERFAEDFAHDPQVYVPAIHRDYSAARTLTLEHVGYIKIGDLAAVEAVGISRGEVARKFYGIFMEQLFVTNFVHADPHPGNVFIKPLAHPDEGDVVFKPDDPVPYKPDRPFQIVFVDFGMMATIPSRLRSALQEFAIGVGIRDARKVVQSYANAGVLLPNADLKRLEQATADMFGRLWGIRMGQVRDLALDEARYFYKEYRDIVYDMPFQFPVDLLFVLRASGILSGMSTNLDPEFDPWAETIPFAERLAQEKLHQKGREWFEDLTMLGQLVYKLPTQLDRVLGDVECGDLTVQTSLAPDARRALRNLEQSVSRLTWVILAVGLLIAGVQLRSAGDQPELGGWLMAAALAVLVTGVLRRR